jgi:hypothetical protein
MVSFTQTVVLVRCNIEEQLVTFPGENDRKNFKH